MATYYNGLELSINIFELGRSVCKNNKAVIQTSSSLGEIRSLYTASQGGSYFAYYNSAGKKIAEISNQDPKNFNKQYLAAHGAETALSVTCPHENAIAGKVANPLTLQDLMYKSYYMAISDGYKKIHSKFFDSEGNDVAELYGEPRFDYEYLISYPTDLYIAMNLT